MASFIGGSGHENQEEFKTDVEEVQKRRYDENKSGFLSGVFGGFGVSNYNEQPSAHFAVEAQINPIADDYSASQQAEKKKGGIKLGALLSGSRVASRQSRECGVKEN